MPTEQGLNIAVIAAIALLGVGCGQTPPSFEPSAQGIIGGRTAASHEFEAVGALLGADYAQICAATVVGYRQIMTASHCTADARYFLPRQADARDAHRNRNHGPIPLGRVRVAPNRADIAIVELAHESGLTPIPAAGPEVGFGGGPDAWQWAGRPITLVAFGPLTPDPTTGAIKRATVVHPLRRVDHEHGDQTTQVLEFETTSDTIDGARGTCWGDSGGVALYGEGDEAVIVGVISSGSGGNCLIGEDGQRHRFQIQLADPHADAFCGERLADCRCPVGSDIQMRSGRPVCIPHAPPPQFTLRSNGGQYAVVEHETRWVRANRSAAGAWERFEVHDLDLQRPPIRNVADLLSRHGAQVIVQSAAHGTLLSCQPDGRLEGNRNRVGAWEVFRLEVVDRSTSQIALRSEAFDRWLVAEGGGGFEMACNRRHRLSWETFTVAAP